MATSSFDKKFKLDTKKAGLGQRGRYFRTQGDGSIVLFRLLSGIKEDGTVPIYVVPWL